MDTETLTEVIAIIDARITRLRDNPSPTDMVRIGELELLVNHLELKQRVIEANIAAMESNTGE